MYTVSVEQLVMRYFVKYTRLDELVPKVFQNSNAKSVNIYIDLYGLYKTLLSRTYRTDISDYTAFIVSIVNMCAHYRGYFKSLRVSTKFFIISSFNVPEMNSKFVASYNKTMYDKLKNQPVKEMIDININLLEVLCPYLPDIHFLKTEFESTVLMNYLIAREKGIGNNNPNIIISTDIYPMQLCCLENTVFLKPRKTNNGDMSLMTYPFGHNMHEDSFWRIVCLERENLASDKNKVMISSSNYMLLMALTRFPERNLKSIVNFTVANKLLGQIIEKSTTRYNISTIFNADKDLYSRYPKELLDSRFKCLDMGYQSILFSESLEPHVIQYENLNDPDAVRLINDKYFSNNPIDIFKLN